MIKFWKPFRVVISLTVLLFLAFIFVDFRQHMPSHGYKAFTWLQFVPSAREFFITLSLVASGGFILVLLLTLLFGRVYCSVICPLGIFQDVISFFSKKLRKKQFRYKYAQPKTWMRYAFLALAVVPLLFGSILALGMLDPYSNFGRIFSDLGRPIYITGNNILANLLIKVNIYSFSPEEIAHVDWITLILPLVILGTIVWLAIKWGRLYCNTVCPVGTFLGFVSKWSIFRIVIDKSSCTKCAQCAFVCKSQCISIKEQEVDFSRCVGCFNCLKSCDNQSITYKFALAPKKKKDIPQTDESKRQFLTGSILLTGAFLGLSTSSKAEDHENGQKKGPKPNVKNHPCSPPGSKSIEHFNSACTACHLCVSVCPNKVLQPSSLQYGLAGFLQPYQDATNGYCNFECTKCSEVCPNGAILPLTVEEKKLTQVGVAQFIKQNCVVYTDETLCGACAEHCPTKAVRMVPYKDDLNIPEVTPNICVGCGACEHACPAKPYRAIYVDGNAVHQVAEAPKEEQLEQKNLEEFPF
ncbi:MAG TPA: 4Fe-4S dicluster domain-containing protein [Bacteroidales bacterium]|nr:4Fe-4S dicluster domain-containing protein [Bacteroidales bacterium]